MSVSGKKGSDEREPPTCAFSRTTANLWSSKSTSLRARAVKSAALAIAAASLAAA